MPKKPQTDRYELSLPRADRKRFAAAAKVAHQTLPAWIREACEMREARVSEAKR